MGRCRFSILLRSIPCGQRRPSFRGESYSTHAQVLGRFNKEFIQTGIFPREFTKLLTRLFEDRQSGDYDVEPGLTETEARQDVADGERIVVAVRQFLESTEKDRHAE
jgi:uncharacterized protein (UPF0332 family)